MENLRRRRLGWGLFFIAPWIIGFVIFTAYPIAASFYFSFTDFNIINFTPEWVGTFNYEELLFYDNLFWKSLGNTLSYMVMLVIIATIFDLGIAFLLSLNVRGISIYRTIFFLPVLVPTVAATMTWVWILNPRYGLFNGILDRIGIEGPPWLASPSTALFSLVLIAVWSSGRAVLIYLAGFNDVPKHLYEAAEIDGANVFSKMRYISLPMLTPQIFFNVITLLIFSMQTFAEPYIMTGGGPNNSTLLYALYLYQRAFLDLDMGYASAMAWILFIIILLLTLVFIQMTRRRVVYDR